MSTTMVPRAEDALAPFFEGVRADRRIETTTIALSLAFCQGIEVDENVIVDFAIVLVRTCCRRPHGDRVNFAQENAASVELGDCRVQPSAGPRPIVDASGKALPYSCSPGHESWSSRASILGGIAGRRRGKSATLSLGL